MKRSNQWLLAAACCLLFTSVGWSQDQLLDELYGRGVHAYFARNYNLAHASLTEAVNGGSQDPRVYFYRALAYSRLGRPDEARADFEKGAALEVQASDVYPVGRSLERVQGADRAALEGYRRNARLMARTNQSSRDAARIEATRRNEAEVLRNPGRASVAPAAATEPAPGDPFGAGGAPLPAPAPVAPPMPAPMPAGDPFGAPAPAPAAAPPAAAPPAAAPPAAADPFGAPAPAAPPAAAPPAAAPPPAAVDPFGGPAPAPAAPPAAAPAAPPPAAADPFGPATPAPAPAPAGDPFGAAAPAPAAAPQGGAAGGSSTLGGLFRAFGKAIPSDPPAAGAPEVPAAPQQAPPDAANDPFKDDNPGGGALAPMPLQPMPAQPMPAQPVPGLPARGGSGGLKPNPVQPAPPPAVDPFG